MRNLIFAAIALIVASVATPASALEKNTEGWSRLQLSFVAGNVKVKPEGIKADGLNGLALGFSKGISLLKSCQFLSNPQQSWFGCTKKRKLMREWLFIQTKQTH